MDELTYESTSRTVMTPKGELHYHVAGQGPPLLLLHGSGPGVSAWANFRGNLESFTNHFKVFMLDLPGYGRSYTPEDSPLLAASRAVLDFLAALEMGPLPIVGNSMGGAIGARLASAHPKQVNRLVTIGGVGVTLFNSTPSEGIKLLARFVEEPTHDRLMTWMESMVYDPSILTDEFVRTRWEAATHPVALANMRKSFSPQFVASLRDRSAATVDEIAMLSSIEAPTLITFGRNDRVTPLDSALIPMRFIPKCELHVFYDCGHWAMIERKEEFESVVLSFLLRDDAETTS